MTEGEALRSPHAAGQQGGVLYVPAAITEAALGPVGLDVGLLIAAEAPRATAAQPGQGAGTRISLLRDMKDLPTLTTDVCLRCRGRPHRKSNVLDTNLANGATLLARAATITDGHSHAALLLASMLVVLVANAATVWAVYAYMPTSNVNDVGGASGWPETETALWGEMAAWYTVLLLLVCMVDSLTILATSVFSPAFSPVVFFPAISVAKALGHITLLDLIPRTLGVYPVPWLALGLGSGGEAIIFWVTMRYVWAAELRQHTHDVVLGRLYQFVRDTRRWGGVWQYWEYQARDVAAKREHRALVRAAKAEAEAGGVPVPVPPLLLPSGRIGPERPGDPHGIAHGIAAVLPVCTLCAPNSCSDVYLDFARSYLYEPLWETEVDSSCHSSCCVPRWLPPGLQRLREERGAGGSLPPIMPTPTPTATPTGEEGSGSPHRRRSQAANVALAHSLRASAAGEGGSMPMGVKKLQAVNRSMLSPIIAGGEAEDPGGAAPAPRAAGSGEPLGHLPPTLSHVRRSSVAASHVGHAEDAMGVSFTLPQAVPDDLQGLGTAVLRRRRIQALLLLIAWIMLYIACCFIFLELFKAYSQAGLVQTFLGLVYSGFAFTIKSFTHRIFRFAQDGSSILPASLLRPVEWLHWCFSCLWPRPNGVGVTTTSVDPGVSTLGWAMHSTDESQRRGGVGYRLDTAVEVPSHLHRPPITLGSPEDESGFPLASGRGDHFPLDSSRGEGGVPHDTSRVLSTEMLGGPAPPGMPGTTTMDDVRRAGSDLLPPLSSARSGASRQSGGTPWGANWAELLQAGGSGRGSTPGLPGGFSVPASSGRWGEESTAPPTAMGYSVHDAQAVGAFVQEDDVLGQGKIVAVGDTVMYNPDGGAAGLGPILAKHSVAALARLLRGAAAQEEGDDDRFVTGETVRPDDEYYTGWGRCWWFQGGCCCCDALCARLYGFRHTPPDLEDDVTVVDPFVSAHMERFTEAFNTFAGEAFIAFANPSLASDTVFGILLGVEVLRIVWARGLWIFLPRHVFGFTPAPASPQEKAGGPAAAPGRVAPPAPLPVSLLDDTGRVAGRKGVPQVEGGLPSGPPPVGGLPLAPPGVGGVPAPSQPKDGQAPSTWLPGGAAPSTLGMASFGGLVMPQETPEARAAPGPGQRASCCGVLCPAPCTPCLTSHTCLCCCYPCLQPGATLQSLAGVPSVTESRTADARLQYLVVQWHAAEDIHKLHESLPPLRRLAVEEGRDPDAAVAAAHARFGREWVRPGPGGLGRGDHLVPLPTHRQMWLLGAVQSLQSHLAAQVMASVFFLITFTFMTSSEQGGQFAFSNLAPGVYERSMAYAGLTLFMLLVMHAGMAWVVAWRFGLRMDTLGLVMVSRPAVLLVVSVTLQAVFTLMYIMTRA